MGLLHCEYAGPNSFFKVYELNILLQHWVTQKRILLSHLETSVSELNFVSKDIPGSYFRARTTLHKGTRLPITLDLINKSIPCNTVYRIKLFTAAFTQHFMPSCAKVNSQGLKATHQQVLYNLMKSKCRSIRCRRKLANSGFKWCCLSFGYIHAYLQIRTSKT